MAIKRLGDCARGNEQARIYNICRKFIIDRRISCPESIWQVDRVTEDIEVFIESICKAIGYAPREDGE